MTVNDRIREWLEVLDRHAPGEEAHAQRVAVLATALGERLGLDDADLVVLRVAAQLHDVGKLHCPAEILNQREPLTPSDLECLRRHPEAGVAIVSECAELRASLPGIASHHERLDGSGYPNRLRDDEIPLQARIVAVAEVYDTLAWRPPYGPGPEPNRRDPMGELQRTPGLDPRVVEAVEACASLITPLGQTCGFGEVEFA